MENAFSLLSAAVRYDAEVRSHHRSTDLYTLVYVQFIVKSLKSGAILGQTEEPIGYFCSSFCHPGPGGVLL